MLCAVSECCELARLEPEPFLRRCDRLWKNGEDGLCTLTSTDDLGDGLMVLLISEKEQARWACDTTLSRINAATEAGED